MGDDLVKAVEDDLESLAFANGVAGQIGPIVDALVNRLRGYGMADEEIQAALLGESRP